MGGAPSDHLLQALCPVCSASPGTLLLLSAHSCVSLSILSLGDSPCPEGLAASHKNSNHLPTLKGPEYPVCAVLAVCFHLILTLLKRR